MGHPYPDEFTDWKLPRYKDEAVDFRRMPRSSSG